LHFDDEVLSWVQEALRASHADKRREQEEAIARLRAEYDRLQRRLDTMYVDRLDGRVDAAFFDKMAAEWRAEQSRCHREIDRHQEADKSYMDEGAQILECVEDGRTLPTPSRYLRGDPDNVMTFAMVCCCASCDKSSGAVEGA